MNDASTLIQDAAHEDANIIFGAVLDESMGEDVKITVIATGFRQEMPERRARMLAEATLPATRHEAPPPRIVPRPVTQRFVGEVAPEGAPFTAAAHTLQAEEAPVMAKAAEAAPVASASAASLHGHLDAALEEYGPIFEDVQGVHGVQTMTVDRSQYVSASAPMPGFPGFDPPAPPAGGRRTFRYEETTGDTVKIQPLKPQKELTPVPASVFDDDFFRGSSRAVAPVRDVPAAPAVQPEADTRSYYPEPRIPTFAGYAAAEPEANLDELDKPAFLRGRNH